MRICDGADERRGRKKDDEWNEKQCSCKCNARGPNPAPGVLPDQYEGQGRRDKGHADSGADILAALEAGGQFVPGYPGQQKCVDQHSGYCEAPLNQGFSDDGQCSGGKGEEKCEFELKKEEPGKKRQ